MEAGGANSALTIGDLIDTARMNDPERRRWAILDLQRWDGRHVRSVLVHEKRKDETIWEGEIEEIAVTGYPKTASVSAWTSRPTMGSRTTSPCMAFRQSNQRWMP